MNASAMRRNSWPIYWPKAPRPAPRRAGAWPPMWPSSRFVATGEDPEAALLALRVVGQRNPQAKVLLNVRGGTAPTRLTSDNVVLERSPAAVRRLNDSCQSRAWDHLRLNDGRVTYRTTALIAPTPGQTADAAAWSRVDRAPAQLFDGRHARSAPDRQRCGLEVRERGGRSVDGLVRAGRWSARRAPRSHDISFADAARNTPSGNGGRR